jgi:DNA-binding GntR family transcriptional regulator
MQVEPIKVQSLEDSVYLSIKDMIVSLKLQPGQALNINEMASLLQVSITPVRAALQLLEREHLVWRVHNKGFYVASLTKTDVENLYEMRRSLEILALQRAIENIDRQKLSELIENMKELLAQHRRGQKKILPYELDYTLHDLIISSCENPYLQNTYWGLLSNIQRYRNLIRQVSLPDDDEWIESELEEHLQMGEYILQKDLQKVTDMLYRHITHLIQVVEVRLAHVGLFAEKTKE